MASASGRRETETVQGPGPDGSAGLPDALEGEQPGADAADDTGCAVCAPVPPAGADAAEDLDRRLRQVSSAYVQLQCEMQSLRERSDRLQEERDRRRRGEVVTSIFEPVQNLHRSLDAWRRQGVAEDAVQGLQLVLEQFHAALRRLGLEPIHAFPVPFDPSIHDAICTVPVQEAAFDGQVVQVFEAGYRVGSHVIQPARVIIGRYQPPEPVAEPQGAAGGGAEDGA